ncbi:RNA polymerase II transcriptional coactivator KIWI isoform X2 [Ziziphus jujuba]|uniref:RNA polymerase II transcriptional coactivator KIWI isoform X2 n=1 Tax=Ziziphus jujuba TaxID=326968 RepID=A0A6P6FST5_ZIZJJ|nr:RNA polymerase II transcriptional coactivator KIWI isoform X2 [Ziziphus jujuba]
MSGREKRKDEEGASDGDSEGHAPPKKNLKRSSDEDSDEIIVCDLSKNRRVKVRNFQGRIMIDIREFYVKDGKELPGKKGPGLTMFAFFLRNLTNHGSVEHSAG